MNTNEIFNQMLSSYDITTELQKRNAIFEVNQQIILSGLYNGGFFNEAAFYGGTCLRIFHGLHRFSEDMDFFCPQYECKNIDEFKDALKKILSSDEVMETIKTLYSKANMLGN